MWTSSALNKMERITRRPNILQSRIAGCCRRGLRFRVAFQSRCTELIRERLVRWWPRASRRYCRMRNCLLWEEILLSRSIVCVKLYTIMIMLKSYRTMMIHVVTNNWYRILVPLECVMQTLSTLLWQSKKWFTADTDWMNSSGMTWSITQEYLQVRDLL